MITRVTKAYWDYDVIYRCILENDGGYQYDIPYTGIRNRQNNGKTVEDRISDRETVRRCRMLIGLP